MSDQGLLPKIAQHGSHFLPLNFTLYSLLPNDVHKYYILSYICFIAFVYSDQYHTFAAVSAVFLVYAK